MKLSGLSKGIGTITLTLAMLLGGLTLGDTILGMGGVIPAKIIHFPKAPLSHSDFWRVISIFVASHVVIFSIISVVAGANLFKEKKRTVYDLYGLIAGFSFTSFGIFLLSDLPFDPDFFASAFVMVAVIFLIAQIIGEAFARTGTMRQILLSPVALTKEAFVSLRSIAGVLVIVSVLIPVVTAVLFLKNVDFANAVTRLRISLNSSDAGTWKFTDLFPGQRFLQPIIGRYAPNGDFYVLERGGRLHRLVAPGFSERQLVLDFSQNVGLTEKENGALGFDFHPHFGSKNALIYVYYTDVSDPENQVNKLSTFDISVENNLPKSSSEFILIAQKRSNSGYHNGGSLEFGPDGFLYLALGEMAADNDHQTIDRNLRGGILRIDPLMQGGSVSVPPVNTPKDAQTQGYFIPTDNPFVDIPSALGEFWALGLRNPFRIGFDPKNGNVWAGDVGSTQWEEINLIESGGNYQFPYIEGQSPTGGRTKPEPYIGQEHGPVYFYRHTAYDRAVIGGTVYRGEQHASLYGNYIFADNYSGKIWAFNVDTIETPVSLTLLTQLNQLAQRGITSIRQTPKGQVIMSTLGKSTVATGRILRLVSAEEWVRLGLQEDVTVPTSTPISTAQAKSLFGENCARCHGDGGLGDGPDASEIDIPLPNFAALEFQKTRNDDELKAIILQGGEALGKSYWMPPWEGIVTEEEANALVEFIRRLDPNYKPVPEGHSREFHKND